MNEENLRSILNEYQKTRQRNKNLLEERINQIHERFPEIKKLSDQIRDNGIKMAKAALSSTSNEELEKLSDYQEKLIYKKNKSLEENNIPSDYLKLKYDCNICKDTGFVESGVQCTCFKQKIINSLYRMSNLEKILEKDNFSNFNLDLYPDETVEGYGKSPKENMRDIIMDVYHYIQNFDTYSSDEKNNLLFWGKPGLGKTFLCSCIAKDILNNGYTVIYQTSFNLMEIIEKYKFHRNDCTSDDMENFRNLFECDLLIIDDLGTELVNSFITSELFNIINDRLNANKKIIISTNLNPPQIGREYTDRVLSRIIGNFKIYEFYGNDLRLK
ncbi:ATP-binding protein [Peptostreptococcus sp. D1]|uniref:ATP-binding protein n=1 Tax=Peptostreptococcus sp. D1 TaxID=72304 RepID=UPI0008E336C3|nr:ATP-binding protein [Peptostreptococcus sp. D1]SFE68988.1 DNA replication protein DnaC [Peptostreptococcus sp. D1]